MRLWLHLVLTAAIAAGAGWIVHETADPGRDVESRAGLTVRMQPVLRNNHQRISKVAGDAGTVDARCFVWGPFSGHQLVGLDSMLRSNGLLERAQIVDRYLPDKWIVYLGRLTNETAVRAFMKQFSQQGVRTARPILSGELSYGVEIAHFDTREQAQAWLDSPKAPAMDGLRVVSRMGEPSDQVDIVFRDVDDQTRERLFNIWKRRPGTQLGNCGFYDR